MLPFEDKLFAILVVAVSFAFALVLWPFYGAILWTTITAIVFAPLYRKLSQRMTQRRSLAAILTVLIIIMIVILPIALIGAFLAQEASGVYGRLQSGELDLVRFFQQILDTTAMDDQTIGPL